MGVVHESYLVDRFKLSNLLEQSTGGPWPPNTTGRPPSPASSTAGAFLLNVGEPQPHENDALTHLVTQCLIGMRTLSRSSFATLELVLPLLGWTDDDTYLFLMGNPFADFVRSFHGGRFVSSVQPTVRHFGWLSQDTASKYAGLLRKDRGSILDPTGDVLQALESDDILRLLEPSVPVRDCLAPAFAEGLERVESAINDSCDLLLYNDAPTYRHTEKVRTRLREFWG